MKKYDLGDKPRGPAVLFVNATWCGHCTATKPEVRKPRKVAISVGVRISE